MHFSVKNGWWVTTAVEFSILGSTHGPLSPLVKKPWLQVTRQVIYVYTHTCKSIRASSVVNQKNLGSNLPSYGQIQVWDYTQWRVVCEFTSHNEEKCKTILNEWWCVRFHHITMRSVRLYSINVVCELTSHNNEKCETILKEWWCVMLTLCLQISMLWLHEYCMGLVLWRRPEHETLCFSV